MPLRWMQVILGPGQNQFIVEAGERRLGWDGLMRGEDSFGWESECNEGRGMLHPGAEFLGHGGSYGVLFGAEESGKNLGQCFRKFIKEHVNSAQNLHLLH